jgi:hypothetical protein
MDQIKPVMSQVVQLMGQQAGADRFQLKVEGIPYVFDFPNVTTSWSSHLESQLSSLPGVRGVKVH